MYGGVGDEIFSGLSVLVRFGTSRLGVVRRNIVEWKGFSNGMIRQSRGVDEMCCESGWRRTWGS